MNGKPLVTSSRDRDGGDLVWFARRWMPRWRVVEVKAAVRRAAERERCELS